MFDLSVPWLSSRWRPKRASDRLLQPEDASDLRSPTLKKTISVESVDPLAELRAEEHAGKWSSSGDAATNGKVRELQGLHSAVVFLQPERRCLFQKDNSSSSGPDETSEEEFVSPSRTRTSESSRPSSYSSMRKSMPRRAASRGQPVDQKEDVMETQRDRWRRFRERKTRPAAAPHLRLKKPRPAPSEPSESDPVPDPVPAQPPAVCRNLHHLSVFSRAVQ